MHRAKPQSACRRVALLLCDTLEVCMTQTSLAKNKMKIVLLEGIHSSAVEAFKTDGYTGVEYFEKSMPEAQLIEAGRGAHLGGIRSATQLTAKVFAGAQRLI